MVEQTSGVKLIKRKPENREQNREEEEMSWIGQYKVSNGEIEGASVLFGRQMVQGTLLFPFFNVKDPFQP